MASVFSCKGEKKWTAQWKGVDGRFAERSTGTTDKKLAHWMADKWETEAIAQREGKVDVRAEACREWCPPDPRAPDRLRRIQDREGDDRQVHQDGRSPSPP